MVNKSIKNHNYDWTGTNKCLMLKFVFADCAGVVNITYN